VEYIASIFGLQELAEQAGIKHSIAGFRQTARRYIPEDRSVQKKKRLN
jgi:hypothetical protein